MSLEDFAGRAVRHLAFVEAPPSARSFWLYWQAIARIRREGVLPKSLRQMLRGMDGAQRYAPSSYESAR